MRIGTAGWTIPREFSEQIQGQGTHLERYSQVFSCAEINSSFHRSHRESTWQRWADSVPDDFSFSVKAPKTFTHVKSLSVGKDELKQFVCEAGALGSKLGPLLFQLPPKLELNVGTAGLLLSNLRKLFEGPIVWEPRHPSWFSDEADSLLREFHVTRAAADPAVVPQAALPGGVGELIYYRLHGSPRKYYSAYSEDYLAGLAAKLQASKAREVWCIFDNTASGAALGNALRLQECTKELPDSNR